MKTPEEIKKGLYHCGADDVGCTGCSYNKKNVRCEGNMEIDALTYIVTLENRLAQVERERDAAVADLKIVRCCGTCINNEGGCTTECYIVSGTLTGWQWRGVCAENSKEE